MIRHHCLLLHLMEELDRLGRSIDLVISTHESSVADCRLIDGVEEFLCTHEVTALDEGVE